MSAGAGEGARVAVVTGGSAGIGLAICHRLLDDGYEVISLARRPSPLDHPKLHSIEVDLTDRAATAAAVAARSVRSTSTLCSFGWSSGLARRASEITS